MIILDEVNGILAGTFWQQRIFLNAIRFQANDLRIPLVCAGTDLARQALLTDAQLAERFDAFHLKPWQNDAAFAGLLKNFERILSLREASDLISGKARERIHKLTSGVKARIFRLIETAAEDTVRAGKEQIRLPVVFPPEADQQPSSWLARMATFYAMTVSEFLGELGLLQRDVFDLEWHLSEGEEALITVRTGVSEVALQAMTCDEFVQGSRIMIARKNRHCCPDCPADVHRKATALPWTFFCATHGTDLHDVDGAALADILGPVRFDALHSHAKTGADTLNSWAGGEGQGALELIKMLVFVTTRHRLASPPNVSEQPRMSLRARRDY